MVTFKWSLQNITPELEQRVGHIILQWAMIDHQIVDTASLVWPYIHPGQRPPNQFTKRVNLLLDYAKRLYANEPEELLIFGWFIQRLKQAGGIRDAIAHGQPGIIGQHGREYPGLMVPEAGRGNRYVPLSEEKIADLCKTLDAMVWEATEVRVAFCEAHIASLPNKLQRLTDGEWKTVTMDNRSPKLPQRHRPPPTFRV